MTTISDGTVVFRFFRPGVKRVTVVGDFNQWREDALVMRPTGDGWWVAGARLKSGEYRFRYLADGEWFTDYASHGVELMKGGYNSVLVVDERHERMLFDQSSVEQIDGEPLFV